MTMHIEDLRRLDLNLLTALAALLDTRHVTRAGERLGLSQPAASRALARLRLAFADPLMVRAADGQLQLTPRAQSLADALPEILNQIGALFRPDRFDPAAAEGTVRIAALDVHAVTILPPLLARLRRAAPKLDIALPPLRRDLNALLAADEADLAIGRFTDAPAGLMRQTLYEDGFVCAVRADHPVVAAGLSLEAFLQLDHALITIEGSGPGRVDTVLAEQGLKRRVVLRLPYFVGAPLVIARSDLIVTLPEQLARYIAGLAPLAVLPPPLDLGRYQIVQAWHPRYQRDARHAWLRGELLAASEAALVETP